MNIRELKRRLQPYSGYMKPAEDGGADGGGTATEEKPDMGNDLDPEPTETHAAAADGGGAGGDGGDPPAGDNTEAEGEDEHRVQHDVEHRAQHHGFHAVGREALAYDELVQAGGQQRKGRTQQVKGEIGLRIRVGGVACAEQPQHRLTKGQDGGGQRRRLVAEGQFQFSQSQHGAYVAVSGPKGSLGRFSPPPRCS